ncbi:MAG: YbaB/EbfC family nucleoid-associated protein [Gammaproteobacteria bacterium]|jgi:DNA-binding YbaB/EbfC family protein|nr:YbaB/EbfC family nucleoid-associated protein [Gammaproteobacteria bacterium]
MNGANMDMNQIMEQAKKMQEKMQEIQEALTNTKVVGESGNGLVRIIMNGRHEAMKVFLDSSLIATNTAEHKQYVEDLIAAAINSCADQVEKASQQQLQGLAQSLNLPSPDDLPN